MTRNCIAEIKSLEGRQVCLALADGSRVDHCQLVSSGRGRADTVWVFANGSDDFYSLGDILACWESGPIG